MHNPGGDRTSSKKQVKNITFHPPRYAESSQRLNKEALIASLPGINAWSTFDLRVEHPYIVRNPWIWVSPPSMLRKLHVTNYSSKPKCVLALALQNTLENCTKTT